MEFLTYAAPNALLRLNFTNSGYGDSYFGRDSSKDHDDNRPDDIDPSWVAYTAVLTMDPGTYTADLYYWAPNPGMWVYYDEVDPFSPNTEILIHKD